MGKIAASVLLKLFISGGTSQVNPEKKVKCFVLVIQGTLVWWSVCHNKSLFKMGFLFYFICYHGLKMVILPCKG